jgi:8-oxo-dGTP diphosphatase
VYGVAINSLNQVLLSDEVRGGFSFTKFPGGGLEWGEGPKETLIRELKEELHFDAVIGDLIYVNDFFQVSAFNPSDHILSFYFRVLNANEIQISDIEKPLGNNEKFRWVDLKDLKVNDLTFPIDKKIVSLISV